MSMAYFAGLPGKVKVLLDRLSDARATKLDNLDALVSTRSTGAEVAKAATWTQTLADKINLNLDKKVSETGTVHKSVVLTSTSAANWTIPVKLKGTTLLVSMIGAGGSGCKTFGAGADANAGGSGRAIQKARYFFSGGEITAGQIAYQCGVGGAAKTTSGHGTDGTATSFGVWSVAGGNGGRYTSSPSRTGCQGAAYDGTLNSISIPAQSYGGPFGGAAGGSFQDDLGGAGGLVFNPSSPAGEDRTGDGYGAGGGASAAGTNSLAGVNGAILLEWEETA